VSLLKDKKILVGISGGIAAYKIPILIRLLIKQGAQVQVIQTPYSKNFVTPLTLSTVSQKPVYSDFFDSDTGEWNSHIELARTCDLMVVAPATATTLSKMANGLADNLLTAVYLATPSPVMIVPAMDVDMYNHEATQQNIEILKKRNNHIILEAEEGELASGLVGKGRMPEPETILQEIISFFQKKNSLNNKIFVVTSGPTYEKIDPVRFIGNFSSGKMGFAIAEELANRGAKVHLVSGPVSIPYPTSQNISLHKVISANEMFSEVKKHFPNSDGAVFAAAVADYKPATTENKKIKRENKETLEIKLEKNPDIAAEIGKTKKENQITVGFALETENGLENALRKLKNKNLDFIVLNSLSENSGFGTDTNKITIIDKYNKKTVFELKHKKEVAKDIVNYLLNFIN
jgi:phosphopantothenoylcysteine decarboxylase/phosphopantothenate--cysteine ligase